MTDKRKLIRIVRTTDGLKIDLSGKMNGRGAYVCKNLDCFAKCIKTKAFSRQLECELDQQTAQQIKEIIIAQEQNA